MRHVSEPIRAVLDVIKPDGSAATLNGPEEFEARKEAETEAPASFKGGDGMEGLRNPHAETPGAQYGHGTPGRKTTG